VQQVQLAQLARLVPAAPAQYAVAERPQYWSALSSAGSDQALDSVPAPLVFSELERASILFSV